MNARLTGWRSRVCSGGSAFSMWALNLSYASVKNGEPALRSISRTEAGSLLSPGWESARSASA